MREKAVLRAGRNKLGWWEKILPEDSQSTMRC
ncbi:MAG: hypothetical protein JWM68_3523 [Verrucomicrobiales bacterium]|nr:hypothetical protein [Verrucomicrobiales bacterium]